MKKILSLSFVIAVIVILLASGDGFSKNDKETVIGASLPLSGSSASIGERVKNAMDLAVEEVNKEGKIHLRVIYEDDKGESLAALSAINKLITLDKVHSIIGPLKSDPLLAIAPVTEKAKVIVFSPTAGAAAISRAGDFVFRNIENPEAHGKGASNLFVKLGAKKIAIFTAKASNATSYSSAFKAVFDGEAHGSIVFSTEYPVDTTDWRTDIQKAKLAGVDAVYVGVATAKDVGLLVRQLRENKFSGPIIASVAAEAKEFLTIAGSASEGVFVTAAPFNQNDPNAKVFAEKYLARYSSAGDGFAANGFDAVMIIAEAIKVCKSSSDTECLRDYLYSIKNYPGVGGLTTFDRNGDVVKLVQMKVVRNGAFEEYR